MNEQTYNIPAGEMDQFCRLPMNHQREIRAMLRVIWAVDHAPHNAKLETWRQELHEANLTLDAQGINTRLKRQTMYNRRAAFAKAGNDWSELVDRRKCPEWDPKERRVIPKSKRGLPESFVDYLHGLAQRHNRSSEQAIDELYRGWRSGEYIPGYGAWTSWFASAHDGSPLPRVAPLPPGWGRRNLARHMPTPAALETARRGVAAGVAALPSIIRTRAGLRPMEYVVFDDWRADFMVFVPGVASAVELNGILAMDVSSAVALRYGIRPALPRKDESKEGLKRVDTKSLVVDMLLRHGYPLDYTCNLIFENGTATLSQADAQALEDITDGQVKCHWTSMISGCVFGWQDRAVGNFKGKAWLESFFNLLHNACGAIPGQIGAHYDKRPKAIPAMEAELHSLVKAEAALPAHIRDTLNYRMPFTNIREAKQALDFVFHFLNHRDHHACEAFEQILKVRLSDLDPWRPVNELLAQGQPREALLALQPRPFIETPMERWNKLSRDVRFGRIPMSAAPMLLADHREVTVEMEGEVNLGSKSNPAMYRDRRSPHLTVGRQFLAYVSSTDDRWCHLTDGRRYICSVAKADAIAMTDTEALSAEIREKTSQLKRTVKRVQSVDLNAQQRLADVSHNLRLAERQVSDQTTALIPAISGRETEDSAVVSGLLGAESVLVGVQERRQRSASRIRSVSGDLQDIFGVEKASQGGMITDEDESTQLAAVDELDRLY